MFKLNIRGALKHLLEIGFHSPGKEDVTIFLAPTPLWCQCSLLRINFVILISLANKTDLLHIRHKTDIRALKKHGQNIPIDNAGTFYT